MALYYLLRWLGIVLLGLLVFGQTFGFDFVFDDHIFIVNNPFIKNLGNFHLMWHSFPLTRLVGMYSFALNYHFSQLNPRGYHIFNFIVHLCAVGLVWAMAGLLFKITKAFKAQDHLTKELPLMIALIFLVHPCQTQAVTYITQRFESMAAVFYLATVYFYLLARVSKVSLRQIILFGLAGFSFIFGILTKEVIITVPVMILVGEWILFPVKRDKRFYIALAVGAAVLYLLFTKSLHADPNIFKQTIWTASVPSESHDGDILTPTHYVLTEMRVFLTFMRLFILPIRQNLEYDYPASTGLLNPPLTLVGLGLILGIVFLIFKLRRKFPLIAFGLAWGLITFSINLVPRSNVIFEHKLYLISFGFFLAFVATLSVLVRDRTALFRILGCIIIVLAVVSFQRNKTWANELLLWEDSIKNSPNKARVNSSLGRVYGSMGRYPDAVYYLSRAIAISPDNITYENRGIIYTFEGRNDLALEDLNKSIAMDPAYYPTYVKRSWVYQKRHRYQEALADLAHVLELQPYYTDAYIERGLLWMEIGRTKNALEDFQQALKIEPFNSQAAQYRNYCLAHPT